MPRPDEGREIFVATTPCLLPPYDSFLKSDFVANVVEKAYGQQAMRPVAATCQRAPPPWTPKVKVKDAVGAYKISRNG
jgi:hypothetical protein